VSSMCLISNGKRKEKEKGEKEEMKMSEMEE
jgi:hypothetical protein